MASPRLKIFHSPLANHFSPVMQSFQIIAQSHHGCQRFVYASGGGKDRLAFFQAASKAKQVSSTIRQKARGKVEVCSLTAFIRGRGGRSRRNRMEGMTALTEHCCRQKSKRIVKAKAWRIPETAEILNVSSGLLT
jgi:hypothetical protein